MIDLTLNKKRDLKNLSINYYEILQSSIKLKLNEHSSFLNNYQTKSNFKLAVYLRAHLSEIITLDLVTILGKHKNELEDIFKKEYVNAKPKVFSEFKKKINAVFNYESLSSGSGYSFTSALGINTCPYCNRNYITTIGNDKTKFVRADIDHFLPKSKYPYLRLSFFNLIPCCVICNRNAKGKKPTSLIKNIHPYVEGFGDDAKFIYQPKTYKDLIGKGNPAIDFTYGNDKSKNKRIKDNIEIFRLKEQYSIHSMELNYLLRLKEAFTETYIQDLINRYPKLKLTKEDAYYYAFGLSYSHLDDEKQPLSKFKRDILQHIDMINI